MNRYIIIAVLLWVGVETNSLAQEENFIAVSIYNFTRYVDWPEGDASSEFIIDIIGHKSVYDKLKDIATGRKVGTKTISVRYVESVNNISKSDILFIGFWQSKDIQKALEKIGTNHTLIISEKDGLLDSGSAINFVIRSSAIKFEIKKGNIQKYGLNVCEALLSLAYKSY